MIIWIASYPRSGNTFVRLVLHHYFGLQTYSVYDDHYDIGKDKRTREIVGHSFLPEGWEPAEAASSKELWLVKTHNLPADDERAIYIIRDGRDVMVSYQKYLEDFANQRAELFDVIAGFVPFGSWSNHVNEWNPAKRDKTLLLRYEDLLSSPDASIESIGAFIDIEPISQDMPSFAYLHSINPNFFRRGASKYWKDTFSHDHELLFWALHSRTMQNHGYCTKLPNGAIEQINGLEEDLAEVIRRLHNKSIGRVNDARNEVNDVRNELDRVKEDRANKQRIINSLLAEHEDVKVDRSMKENAIKRLSEELEALRSDYIEKNKRIDRLANEVEQIREDQRMKELAISRLSEDSRQKDDLIREHSESLMEQKSKLLLKNSMHEQVSSELLAIRSLFAGILGNFFDLVNRGKKAPTLKRIKLSNYDLEKINHKRHRALSSELSIGLDLMQIQPGRSGGVEVYADTLVRAIQEYANDLKLFLLVSQDQLVKYRDYRSQNVLIKVMGNAPSAIDRMRKARDYRMGLRTPWANYLDLTFSRLLTDHGISILHSPVQIFSRMDFGIPSILHIHDLQHKHFPEYFTEGDLRAREILYSASGILSSAVVVSSEFSKIDLLRFLDIDSRKVHVIPVAANPDVLNGIQTFPAESARQFYRLPDLFGFYPAQFWKHKNHRILIEALAITKSRRPNLNLKLIFTGNTSSQEWQGIQDHINEYGLESDIFALGIVPANHLGGIYQAAAFCIVPSLFEASSFPIIEAQLIGCPTLSSNVTSLPELMADGAGLLFNPYSAEDISDKMILLLDNPELEAEIIHKGKQRAKSVNNLEAYALRMAKLYRQMAKVELGK